MTIQRFSKPSLAVIKNKKSFFLENEKHLQHVKAVNRFYCEQPPRDNCMICNEDLGEIDLIIHGVNYSLCKNCNQLNGRHQDTKEFSDYLYSDSDGSSYSKNYLNDYNSRVQDIYIPKVDFLKEVLGEDNVHTFAVTDIGCGGGHFVKACEDLNIKASGYDVNKSLINLGSKILKKNKLFIHEPSKINESIKEVKTEVLSLIGVLEHLMRPIEALHAFQESKAKYLYLQVPLFSFAAMQESMHEDVFPRQLNAGHTHLFTKESLDFICNQFSFKKSGEWWFGTDMVDLFRHMHIKVNGVSSQKSDIIQRYIGDHIDSLQAVLDQTKLCSGVNMVLKKS